MTKKEIAALIEKHHRLIPFFIKLDFGVFPLVGTTADECWHVGRIGLMRAARKWDQKRPFSTYAHDWIFNAAMRLLHGRQHLLHIGISTQNNVNRFTRFLVANKISAADVLNDEAWQKLSGFTDKTLKNICLAIERGRKPIYLDDPIGKDGTGEDKHLAEIIPSSANFWRRPDASDDPARLFEDREIRDTFEKLLLNGSSGLSLRRCQLLRRIFIEGEKQATAGRELGMSPALTSHHVRTALKKIRSHFRALYQSD